MLYAFIRSSTNAKNDSIQIDLYMLFPIYLFIYLFLLYYFNNYILICFFSNKGYTGEISMENVHSSNLRKANLKRHYSSNLFSKSEFQNYTKFAVIRHPIDRVLSVYYNTQRDLRNKTAGQFGPTIESMFKGPLHLLNNSLTLSQMIQVITNRKYGHSLYGNRHWNPYSQSCSFCSINYDHIVRIETMNANSGDNDAAPIMKIFGYEGKDMNDLSVNRERSKDVQVLSTSKYFPQLRELSKDLLDALLERYSGDMELFGYGFNTTTYRTWCKIPVGNTGDTCC